MWELDYKESWALKNWCFWTVMLEKTLESPLDCKEIQPVHPKGNHSWIFIGRTDAEAITPIVWLPDVKNWLIGKDPDAGKDLSQEEKGTTEDEMVGWHCWLDGQEFEQGPGVGNGQGSLVCCNPWGCRRIGHDWASELNWNDTSIIKCKREIINICPCLLRRYFMVCTNTLATSCKDLTHWKRPWCWEGLGAGGEGDNRGWDGWMSSQTRWTWVWVNTGGWWWTGRPGVLRFMGWQRVRHDWATELTDWPICRFVVTSSFQGKGSMSILSIWQMFFTSPSDLVQTETWISHTSLMISWFHLKYSFTNTRKTLVLLPNIKCRKCCVVEMLVSDQKGYSPECDFWFGEQFYELWG